MEISQDKYKYMYIIKDLKNSLKRGEQTLLAKEMDTDSQAISGILNGSRTTSIEVLNKICSNMKRLGMYNRTFKELEKEADTEAFIYKYGSGEALVVDGEINEEERQIIKMYENLSPEAQKEVIEYIKFKKSTS